MAVNGPNQTSNASDHVFDSSIICSLVIFLAALSFLETSAPLCGAGFCLGFSGPQRFDLI